MDIKKKYYSIIAACCLMMTIAYGGFSQDIPPQDNVEESDVVVPNNEESSPEDDLDTASIPGSHVSSDPMGSESHTPNVSFSSLMSQSLREMKNAQLTGYLDKDFAKLMAEHHKGAIQMAELYLVSGTNDQLKQFAENMINRKAIEYEKLLSFADQNPLAQLDSTSTSGLLEPMERMVDRNVQNQPSNNLEKDFVSVIMDHHKSGIEMAELEMYMGKDKELKEIAKKIKEEDRKEIEQLNQWQNQIK